MRKSKIKIGVIVIFIILSVSCSKEKNNISMNDKTSVSDDVKVTFIELGSVRCIPCKMMQPIMEEVEKEYKDQVKVVFHDVWTDEGKPYAAQYNIQAIPTQVFLDENNNEYYRHTGFFPKDELVKVLKQKGVE